MGKLAGLARMTTLTTGTGTVTLLAAITDRLTFALAGITNGDTVSYGLVDLGTGDLEMGEGVYASAGPTLTRTSVGFSTNGGNAISISGSGAEVYITPLPKDFGLQQITSASPTGTGVVTFSSIPQNYSNLLIIGSGRSTAGSSPGVNVALTFNNDGAGTSYDIMQWQLANAAGGTNSQAAQATISSAGFVPWSGATANNNGGFRIEVINYALTSLFKHGLTQTTSIGATTIGASNIARYGGFMWRSTSAINRVDLTLAAGNWDTGSKISLYGMY